MPCTCRWSSANTSRKASALRDARYRRRMRRTGRASLLACPLDKSGVAEKAFQHFEFITRWLPVWIANFLYCAVRMELPPCVLFEHFVHQATFTHIGLSPCCTFWFSVRCAAGRAGPAGSLHRAWSCHVDGRRSSGPLCASASAWSAGT